MQALEPIWIDKTETASRVRGRIESILDWATTKGHRRGENPARLKGHLDNLLPKQSKIHIVEHHKALAYTDICGFLKQLKGCKGVSARGLEFLILTAARTNEV
ncbi:MAG: hypothetical protein JKY12_09075, partial [Sneathiella sp.]|nr:hypothetical protein [Sneathiella sp.]